MAISVIDGTVVASEVKRSRKGTTIFQSIRFAMPDGTERTMKTPRGASAG